MEIRISRGVGSSPKMWAVLTAGRYRTQVGEFDVSEMPGVIVPGEYCDGMTGIVWRNSDSPADVLPRKAYASADEWVLDVTAEWPGAEIVRADSEPQNWI